LPEPETGGLTMQLFALLMVAALVFGIGVYLIAITDPDYDRACRPEHDQKTEKTQEKDDEQN
jgi:hypothetical protein